MKIITRNRKELVKITFGELQDKFQEALSHGMKIEYEAEEQDWFDPFSMPYFLYRFSKATIWANPKRVMLSTVSKDNMSFLFVDSAYTDNSGCYYIKCGVCADNLRLQKFKFVE